MKLCRCKSVPERVYTAFLRDEQVGVFPVLGQSYWFRPLRLQQGEEYAAMWVKDDRDLSRPPDFLVYISELPRHFVVEKGAA